MTDVLPGPGDVVEIRASGLAELFDDSLRWKSKHLDRLRGKTYGRSHLGTSIHFGTAHFDRERILEDGNPDATAAVEKFLEMFRLDEGVHWVDIDKREAEKIGIRLTADYCNEVSPQFNFVSVEATCEPLMLEMDNGITLMVKGTLDRVYEDMGEHGIVDMKSGYGIIAESGDVKTDAHGPQLATYELLEALAGKIGFTISRPAIIIGLSTRTGKIEWASVKNPRSLLFGDANNMGFLQAASLIIEHQLYIGNPRSMLCTERYCPIFNECFYRIGRSQ